MKTFAALLACVLLCVAPAGAVTIQLRQANGLLTELGGTLTLATGVTTNTTSAAVAGVTGNKTFWAEVICSAGACTQTVEIYGARVSAATNGLLLCTITLSATPRHQDACAVSTATYPYYYVVTTNTSGTGATGAVYVFY